MISPSLKYLLAAIRIPGVGPVTLQKLITHFGDLESLLRAPIKEWKALGFKDAALESLKNPDWKSIEKELHWATVRNNYIVTLDDEDYPPLLKETVGAPTVLYVRGNQSLLREKQVAMVGSRNPSASGLEAALEFSQGLVRAGLIVTSGLALGIDGASHRGALKADGQTIAVLGSGFNHIYPKRHASLAEEIVERGALVSEFYLDTLPQADNFPRRNRIISGLSLGVFVVEAALQSGSLITARYAAEQGRDVFALPGSLRNPLSKGGHSLIKDGAKLVESVEDITSEIVGVATGYPGQRPQVVLDTAKEMLDSEHQFLLNCMGIDVIGVDHLVQRSRMSIEKVLRVLTELEMLNYISSVSGGYVLL